MTKAIRVILGSVRAGRLCPIIAQWVTKLGREMSAAEFTLVDLKDRHLPMDDEPNIPAQNHGYTQKHTLAWSREIDEAGAFIIVTPQYNGATPAPLKNAIDHLCDEWAGKPVLIVTYGMQGGTKCAEQVRQLVLSLKMRPTVVAPAIMLPKNLNAPLDPDADFADYVSTLRNGLDELSAMLHARTC